MSFHESRRDEYEQQPELRRKEKQKRVDFDPSRDLLPYQIVLGGKPIHLEVQEYRFLLFLAQRPYHAYSTKQILRALNEGQDDAEVTEASLRELVRGLRDKLGFFWDFVQVVPYIGYRFRP